MDSIKKKKQSKKDAKKAKTFLELKKKKGSEILKRLQSRDIEAMRREDIKKMQEKKTEQEARAIRTADIIKEREAKIIEDFRRENPNISQSDFSKLVKREYGIDIGQAEPLARVELADAKRKLIEREKLRAQAQPRRDDVAIAEEARIKRERELEKILEANRAALERGQKAAESERTRIEVKRRLATEESERKAEAARQKLAAEEELVRRKVAEQAPVVAATQRTQMEKQVKEQDLKKRGKLLKEFSKELTYYEDKLSKSEENLKDLRRKYDKAFRGFEKRVAGKQEKDYTQAEQDAADILKTKEEAIAEVNDKVETLNRALQVLAFNKRLTEGIKPLEQLKEMEDYDAQTLGLSKTGQRVVGVRAAAAAAMPALAPPPAAAAAAAPAAANAADAALVAAIAQPPANIVAVAPDANAANANALANIPPANVAAVNAQPAGTGLMRHLSIHPSHITETADSYKLTKKGLKHGRMLMKYLPNHAKKIIAFSILNKARNKIHNLDTKKMLKTRGGGIADQLEQGLMDSLAEGFMSMLD